MLDRGAPERRLDPDHTLKRNSTTFRHGEPCVLHAGLAHTSTGENDGQVCAPENITT